MYGDRGAIEFTTAVAALVLLGHPAQCNASVRREESNATSRAFRPLSARRAGLELVYNLRHGNTVVEGG